MGQISDKLQSACDEAITLLTKEISTYDLEIQSGKYSAPDLEVMRTTRQLLRNKVDAIYDFKYEVGEFIKAREK